MAELAHQRGKPMPEADEILACVHDRCQQLQRMQRIPDDALQVVPSRGADLALAGLVASMLCFRGQPARAWTEARGPRGSYLLVGDGPCARRGQDQPLLTITTLGGEDCVPLADLLDAAKPLPWAVALA